MSKPTIKDLQAEVYSLKARHAVLQASNEKLFNEVKRLKGSPKVQEQLNMANATVAELMKEVETLKKEKDNFEVNYNIGNESYEKLYDTHVQTYEENEKLKSDYAQLEDNYSKLDNFYNELIDKYNKATAENHALKAEIERTNRHINLAENVIHEAKEQQPTVINHYHNCTINK